MRYKMVQTWLWATMLVFQQVALADQQDDRRLQSEQVQIPLSPAQTNLTQTHTPMPQGMALEVSEADLLANPELLHRAMLSALIYNNAQSVAVLLPIYKRQKAEYLDKELMAWAMAVVNTAEQDYAEAVKKYRGLYKKYPNNPIIAVRYGQALFANRQYADAKQVFLVQSQDIRQELLPYLTHIDRLERIQVGVSGNFLSDKNINNAPNDLNLGGGWTANPPESANGIFLNTHAGKRYFLDDGAFLYPELTANGKFYWDARHYNEATMRLSLGIGKQSAKHQISINPFYERTDYAGGNKKNATLNHFSDALGIGIDASVGLGQSARLLVSGELAQNDYKTRKHLNGYTMSFSPTISFAPSALGQNAVASVGTDFAYTSTRDKDDSYRRFGVRGAIVKEWGNVGMRGSVGFAKREYLAPMPIFNKLQENDEYHASLSLWHNKLSYKSLIPHLTWQYHKTDSTIPLYSYDKNRIFVEISGGF